MSNSTPIPSYSSQEKEKLQYTDPYKDFPEIPGDVTIYYSKSKNILQSLFFFPLAGIGVFVLFFPSRHSSESDSVIGPIFAIVFIGIGLFGIFYYLKRAFDRSPQIIFSTEGLYTSQYGYYPWSAISEEQIIEERKNKTTQYTLSYKASTVEMNIILGDMSTSTSSIRQLLYLYRMLSKTTLNESPVQ